MANKNKGKPQVINNIQELNLEIDYDKLAEAIVKSQNQLSTIESYNKDSHEYMYKTLSGKTKRNYFSFSIGKLVSWLFFAIGLVEAYFTVVYFPWINNYFYNLALSQNHSESFARVMGVSSVIALLIISMLLFCVLFNIAKEISKEKDRNYIISVFSGTVSFAALIVALVALFKEVG